MYNKINSLKNFNEDVISLKHDILNTNPMYGDKNSKLEKFMMKVIMKIILLV